MNDDEINLIISRDEREQEIFRDMDIQRIREQKNNWQLAGHHGPPPQPLMQLDELPECYRNDEFFDDVKNMEYFEKKFKIQSAETVRATEDIILRESDRVITAVTTGPQDRILDKVCITTKHALDILLRFFVQDIYSIWKDMVRLTL